MRLERSKSQEKSKLISKLEEELLNYTSNIDGYVKRVDYNILVKNMYEQDQLR